MSAHYCKVCGKHSPGDAFLFDKDSNDLCVRHGQELLEKLEAEVQRLSEAIKSHQQKTIRLLLAQDAEPFETDLELWSNVGITEAGGAGDNA